MQMTFDEENQSSAVIRNQKVSKDNKQNHSKNDERKRKNKRKGAYKSSWFSVIFIACVSLILIYSIHKIYIHFPTTSSADKNNDDVVKGVISNEEADLRLAESVKQYEQQLAQQKEEENQQSGGEKSRPHKHNILIGMLLTLKNYFDLRPLRNMLIRAGLYSVSHSYPAASDSDKESAKSGSPVYQIDSNTGLSDRQKSDLIERETGHIAALLTASKGAPAPPPSSTCDPSAATDTRYQQYFSALTRIYGGGSIQETCVPHYISCGWPRGDTPPLKEAAAAGAGAGAAVRAKSLPLLVVAVGGEGSGHHTWSALVDGVVDCILTETNQFKYNLVVKKATLEGQKSKSYTKSKSLLTEKVLAGFPHLTPEELGQHMFQQVPPNCRSSFDALDSFPYGLIESRGRHLNHPDLVNLQQLDGVSFRLKYLILVRNNTDSTMSALGRKFVKNIDAAVRTVEASLTYMDAALRGIPCHKTLIVHFEHVKARPADVLAPLTQFLELDSRRAKVLERRLFDLSGRSFSKRDYDFDYLGLCQGLQGAACSQRVRMHINDFLERREYMWPTFAGRGRAAIT